MKLLNRHCDVTSLRLALLLGFAALGPTSLSAATPPADLRTLVTFSSFSQNFAPDDARSVKIDIFRNGLLRYDSTVYWDTNGGRGSCPNSYTFGLGVGTQAQLAKLQDALLHAHVADLRGDCTLSVGGDSGLVTTYKLFWESLRGDRVNSVTFYADGDPLNPPPATICANAVQAVRDAILTYSQGVLALRTTKTATGSACFPDL